ncbi:ATP-dependent DNA helicase [Pokkaliibacter sp. MBI-7]|uniref:ATP-dependent DNA helicase n=1 Tax=Pokkaliibacter sp. MBI-7 TaxID=3040600 RepID=UPI00244B67DA|nr:ATP-dependent DNA helicase [Pokkaliibacter sp. MBI-7]MDH2435003.1 ATP-dependent DNA helicase [Pokkaliibacter sp. MBI-7]
MLKVAVRTLCEFAARSGDLSHRYTPAPTAEEGMAGHRLVQSRRTLDYQAELLLEGECSGLLLSGRADGYLPHKHILEEIKTHRGDVARIGPAQRTLHWAQLKVYGALLCARDNLKSVTLRLVYFDIVNDKETQLQEQHDRADLWQHLEALCQRFRYWAEQEQHHRELRDSSLLTLSFPYAQFRQGQRQLAENVYKTVYTGKTLMLQAPTGIGKTLGVLYPALTAMPRKALDRLFFLTARNTGKQLAVDAARQLLRAQTGPLPLRIVELSSKDNACEHPTLACSGESCPLAKGFFDRLADARAEAVQSGVLDKASLRRIALGHDICPYFLAQEMARWCDVVIADVNQYFDQQAMLYSLTLQNDWQVVTLIDEAHNLINRARGMYSAELHQARLKQLKKQLPADLKKPLEQLQRKWRELIRSELEPPQPDTEDSAVAVDEAFTLATPPAEHARPETNQRQRKGEDLGQTYLQQRPLLLDGALARLISAIIDYLTDHPADAVLQELLFECIGYQRLAETYGDHSVAGLSQQQKGKAVTGIHNLIPADFLAPRFLTSHATVLFSATLAPAAYYRDLLGLPDNSLWLDTDSPFRAEQLQVRLVNRISTRYKDRQQSIRPMVARILQQYRQAPGNYLVYLSSFAYLNAVYDALKKEAGEIHLNRQQPSMSDSERQAFIDSFQEGQQQIGFAVLGGVFAEGIDLPGQRLIGVFVATLGLPPYDHYHELLQQRMQQRFERGYDYTYLYPGMQKVIQAAGRVIRTTEDTGVVELIDDRFVRAEVRQLLPGWWQPQRV